MFDQNLILKIKSGSHLYGTSLPTSDEDFVGIFLPEIKYILGLSTVKEVDMGQKDKDESGKNTKDAIDYKIYEFRNFIKLALGNNPNILELLFAPQKSIVFINGAGEDLQNIRHLFLSKLIYDKFIGYAMAQKHKMQIKTEKYQDLHQGYVYLQTIDPKALIIEVFDKSSLFSINNVRSHVKCGDINFEKNMTVHNVMKLIKRRTDQGTHRQELILKYGLDPKFASHLIRLLFEGLELLETHNLEFPLKEKDFILYIKQGNMKINEVLELSTSLEDRMRKALENTTLPSTPKFHRIEEFVINTLTNIINRQ